ncbi:hypothetical protein PHOSAC3_90673 [Mesotoga infera]|nr:hypothetical protein PHOSAC3_90673 [Mesotoga infera]
MLPTNKSQNDRPTERTVNPVAIHTIPAASNLKGPNRFERELTTIAEAIKASVGSESKTPAI